MVGSEGHAVRHRGKAGQVGTRTMAGASRSVIIGHLACAQVYSATGAAGLKVGKKYVRWCWHNSLKD